MLRINFTVILMLFCLSFVCRAEELTVDALIRGANQARRTIQSGEVITLTTVKRTTRKSEEEIIVWQQIERKRELKAFIPDPLFPNVGLKEFGADYLTPHLNFRANRERQRTEIKHTTTLFQILEADNANLPTLYQYKLTSQELQGLSLNSQNAQHLQDSRFYFLAYDTQTQVKQDIGNILFPTPSSNSVQFFGSDKHGGFWDFSLFGRSSYLPTDAQLVGKAYVGGAECHVLAYTYNNGGHAQIWVDTAKDFCIRKSEYRRNSSEASLFSHTVFKQFKRFGDVWFPTVRESTHYREDSTVKFEIRVDIKAAQFNVDFPKNFFRIDREFYRQPNLRGPEPASLPNSGMSFPTPVNKTDSPLLLCGPQSLLRICEILKVKTNLRELKKLSGFDQNSGTTMLGLKEASTYKGLVPTGVKASLTLLKRKKVPLPAIAYVERNHFLVFEAVNKKGVDISDPAQKYSQHLTWDELSNIWEGELLIFNKKKARRAKQKQMPLAFTETPEYDFGKALGGSEIKHTFTLKNIGQKPLKILSVTETCACTASVLSRDEIPAGGTGNISAVLTVPSGNTQVEESLLVLTNDPTQSTLALTLKGQAFIPLTTFPERLALGNQKPLQEPLTKRVSLHVQSEVQILGVRTNSEHLQAKLEIEGKIPHVEVQVLPSIPIGQFSHNFLIDYRYQGQETTHDVLVFGEVCGALQVVPKRLFLGLIKDPSAASKYVTISSRDNTSFKITAVESSTKAVIATVKKTTDKTRYQLTATLHPKAQPGEFSGEIVVQTSSSVQPTLRVPFFGILADVN